jgi:hypothetical protein
LRLLNRITRVAAAWLVEQGREADTADPCPQKPIYVTLIPFATFSLFHTRAYTSFFPFAPPR